MTTITTQRNKIFTEQPEPDDVMVEVILFGEGDTPGTVCGRKLRHLPITHYQECLDWAVGIADHMARPIYVVPRHFQTMRDQMAVDAALAELELEQLRQAAPAMWAIMGRTAVEPAPVVTPEAEPATPPEPVGIRVGAPDLPFDLRYHLRLR